MILQLFPLFHHLHKQHIFVIRPIAFLPSKDVTYLSKTPVFSLTAALAFLNQGFFIHK